MSLVSIITPTFNEVENIEPLSLKIKEICETNKINYEQIIIDNDSTDGTIEVIRKLTSQFKSIKAIINQSNFGQLKTFFYALKQSNADAVIMLPSDFQTPPEIIIDYYNKWIYLLQTKILGTIPNLAGMKNSVMFSKIAKYTKVESS